MSKFEVGDKVKMAGVPFVVEVLELRACEDSHGQPCDLGGETFRFKDPENGDDDWMHSSEFEKVD